MSYALYITHPQVMPDAAIPRTEWRLSPLGQERASRFARHSAMQPVMQIVSSSERKALELAAILAAGRGAVVESAAEFGESRRTGFEPPERFEALLDEAYARPEEAPEGWESALDAQRRIVAAIAQTLGEYGTARPIAFCGHGTVGTLLKCHLGLRAISRDDDQRRMADPGGGNVFAFRLADCSLLTDWLSMEQFALPPIT